jgi:GT2 family glycosyltransferase
VDRHEPRAQDDAVIDVVIVNYRSADHVVRLARQLDGEIDAALCVVDCGGLDADARSALSAIDGLEVSVLDPGGNVGFGPAANLGAAASDNDVILFVNPDVMLVPAALAGLATPPGEGVVAWTGRLADSDGGYQRNTASRPSLSAYAVEYLLGRATAHARSSDERVVGVISGALLFVRRDAFQAVGGFDERYPLYVEDVDLCERLGRLGQLVQRPVDVAFHVGGESASSAPVPTWALLHASRVAHQRRRQRWRGSATRALVLLGCSMRLARPKDRHRSDLRLLWRATSASFDLRRLLPAGRVSS